MPLRSTLLLALAACSVLLCQTVSTEILGLVTDPTGAVITGATVTARRVATGDVRTTTTNATGDYLFESLTMGGDYIVTPTRALTIFRTATPIGSLSRGRPLRLRKAKERGLKELAQTLTIFSRRSCFPFTFR